MQQLATRPWITAGVALAGAGVIAATPVTVPLPNVHVVQVPDIALTSGEAADITLDFVRHGQSQDNVDGILGTLPPGAPLTDLGEQQAITVGNELYNNGDNNIIGIYASQLLRTQQTAWPLDQLMLGNPGDSTNIPDGPPPLLDPDQILSGLNEVDSGFLEGSDLNAFTEIAYLLPQVAWILGLYFVPMLGAEANPNGMAFEDRFSDAVQTIYGNAPAGADVTDTDAVFSHAGAITAWTLMNVNNPDFSVVIKELVANHVPLSNTGQVVVEGNPTDGWTLISWDGTPVGPADLGTELFVDLRDLITAPQMALWHLWEAIISGDTDTIVPALQDGLEQVGAAIVQFPESVFTDIADGLQNAGGEAAGQTAATLGDAFAL